MLYGFEDLFGICETFYTLFKLCTADRFYANPNFCVVIIARIIIDRDSWFGDCGCHGDTLEQEES